MNTPGDIFWLIVVVWGLAFCAYCYTFWNGS